MSKQLGNKICVFLYDWVLRPINHDEIFPHNKKEYQYRYYKMSQLNDNQKTQLPMKYKSNGWTVIKKSIFH